MRAKPHKRDAWEAARWTAYATASAATALAGTTTAEAHIHYSGPVNSIFKNSDGTLFRKFPLENGASIFFQRFIIGAPNSAIAVFGVAASSAHPRAPNTYISRLGPGENVSNGPFFVYGYGILANAAGSSRSYWRDPGPGFVGFKFNNGSGVQYGWARIKTTGADRNAFVLQDYAFGDVGDPIRTGQTRDAEAAAPANVPTSGSLALLALGGAGLLAWRRAR